MMLDEVEFYIEFSQLLEYVRTSNKKLLVMQMNILFLDVNKQIHLSNPFNTVLINFNRMIEATFNNRELICRKKCGEYWLVNSLNNISQIEIYRKQLNLIVETTNLFSVERDKILLSYSYLYLDSCKDLYPDQVLSDVKLSEKFIAESFTVDVSESSLKN
jgi:hypothetical protein